jgi:hypothetical protein
MVSIAACGALDKMDAYEDGMRAAEPAREPVEVIRALAVEWPAVAAACAAEIGIDPSAIPELSEEQRKRLQERERSYALDWIRQNPAEAQAILKAFPHAA